MNQISAGPNVFQDGVNELVLSEDERCLVSIDYDSVLAVWDFKTQQLYSLLQEDDSGTSSINCVHLLRLKRLQERLANRRFHIFQ